MKLCVELENSQNSEVHKKQKAKNQNCCKTEEKKRGKLETKKQNFAL